MKDSLDQHDGHSPLPSTGTRQTAHKCGSATSSVARNRLRTASAARLTGAGTAKETVNDMIQAYRPARALSFKMTRLFPRGRHFARGGRCEKISR